MLDLKTEIWDPLISLAAAAYNPFTLGLITVVIGALFNAELNRRRDDRLKANETKAVAAALYGEILLMRQEIARTAKRVAQTYKRNPGQDFDKSLLEEIALKEPVIYPALASKLGLLPPDAVLGVTKFHADFEAVRFWLPNLINPPDRKFSYGVSYVLEPATKAVFGIKPTLRLIEKLLGVKSEAEDPNMNDATDALDWEQEQRRSSD